MQMRRVENLIEFSELRNRAFVFGRGEGQPTVMLSHIMVAHSAVMNLLSGCLLGPTSYM